MSDGVAKHKVVIIGGGFCGLLAAQGLDRQAVDVTMIDGAGHSLHREAPEATLAAVSEFANRILRVHEGAPARAA